MTKTEYPYDILTLPTLGPTLVCCYIVISTLLLHGYIQFAFPELSAVFGDPEGQRLVQGFILFSVLHLVVRVASLVLGTETTATVKARTWLLCSWDILSIIVYIGAIKFSSRGILFLGTMTPVFGGVCYPIAWLVLDCWSDLQAWISTNHPPARGKSKQEK